MVVVVSNCDRFQRWMRMKSVIIRAVKAFLAINRRASKRVEAPLLHAVDIFVQCIERVKDVANSMPRKPGGYWIHLFPSKFAPFALINQSLPKAWSRTLVGALFSSQKVICGFPARDDACYYSAMVNLLHKNGFDLIDVTPRYYQSQYFSFFFPLFVLSAACELLVWRLGLRNMAAYLLIVARKAGT